MLTLQEKLCALQSSNSFADLSKEVLPVAHKEDYYFVSYSHKDYKTVLKDILLLEDMGINIWYDSDMHIGENWEHIAETYISKFQCKGIIFYLSEHSILSPACNKEIEYVLENDKHFFSINIPLEGRNVTSGHRMLLDLMEMGREVSPYTLSLFERAFSDKVLFLAESDFTERKVEKIKELRGEDLFTIRSTISHGDSASVLDECKDNTMVSLSLKNNYRVNDESDTSFGEILPLSEISACAFTNSFKLREVTLPPTLTHIRENAFRNSAKLKNINLHGNLFLIGNSAFRKCKSLEVKNIGAKNLGDSVFWGCDSLSELIVDSRSAGRYCFAFCKNLKSVKFTVPQYLFSSSTFSECESLEYVYYNSDTPNYIVPDKDSGVMERDYLSGTKGIKEFTIAGNLNIERADYAFSRCNSLEKFTFDLSNPTVIPPAFLSNNSELKEVVGTEKFTIIEERAFQGASSLSDINLGSAEQIGSGAFEGSGLIKLQLPSIKKIGRKAFSKSSLNSVILGKDLIEIGDTAFANCASIMAINVFSKDLILDDPSIFYGVNPNMLMVSNRSQLAYFMEHCSASLNLLYLPLDLFTHENLALIPYDYAREECKINGIVKLRITLPNPYLKFLDKRVVMITNGDEIRTRIKEIGYDEELGEHYVECFDRFYASDIISIELDPYYE